MGGRDEEEGGRRSRGDKALAAQVWLERHADLVHGAAAFFVALAILLLLFTPTSVEVDAAGRPVRVHRPHLPTAFKLKLAHSLDHVGQGMASMGHALYGKMSFEAHAAAVGGHAGQVDGWGMGQAADWSADGTGAREGSGPDARRLEQDNQALRSEVSELRGQVGHLEGLLEKVSCLSITAARTGMCVAQQSEPAASGSTHASTTEQAVLRPAGYRRDHAKWRAAKDHWAETHVTVDDSAVRRGRYGFKINTHNPDTEDIFISRAVHRRQIWDRPVFEVFKHVLLSHPPGGRVLDVGGNIGYFTMWGLAMGHKVTTFEPMDFNVRYIATSIDANSGFADNHTLFQNAVGNAPGRLSLLPTNKQNRGNFQVQAARPGEGGGEYGLDYVDTVRLDDVVDEDVLLIKIDVEGFEHKVLDGARRLLCNRVVQHIEFEFTTSRIDSACPAEQLLCWFTTVGYRATSLEAIARSTGPAATLDARETPLSPVLHAHDWSQFPSEVLLTLEEPLLPPALQLDLSATWNNPCQGFARPRDDPYWDPYKDQWCAATFVAAAASLAPCNVWGSVTPAQQRIYSGIGCDRRLGFDCAAMALDVDRLNAIVAGGNDGAVISDWLVGFGHYYHTSLPQR